MTLSYYDQYGDEFFRRTVQVNMSHLYDMLLAHLPSNAHILDAGCGSGRDSRVFLERGFRVSAFDGSEMMAQLAASHTGLPVRHLRFEEMDYVNEFDGIWASASLLHVPMVTLRDVFASFIRALKPGGFWYVSFKMGQGEKLGADGRHFTYFDRDSMRQFIGAYPNLSILDMEITEDARPDHTSEFWLNVLLRKAR